MRRGARFHADQTRWQGFEKPQHLPMAQLLPDDNPEHADPLRNCGLAELDQSRLVGMKGEPEACESCFEAGKEPLCPVLVLQADNGCHPLSARR